MRDKMKDVSKKHIKVKYKLIEEAHRDGIKCRTSYGITVYGTMGENGAVSIIASAKDISSDRKKLEKLVRLCNRLELAPIHLYDVIEDFLGS